MQKLKIWDDDAIKSYTEQCRTQPVGRYLLQREIGFINRILKDVTKQTRIFDLGYGNGLIDLKLRQEGFSIIGMDIDRAALAALQLRSHEVPLVQGYCLSLPFIKNSLEFIIAIHCFDHLDRLQFLRECERALSPAGLLIFDALNRHSYKPILKRLHHQIKNNSFPNNINKYLNILSWA